MRQRVMAFILVVAVSVAFSACRQEHRVELLAVPGEAGEVSGGGTYPAGDDATVAAEAEEEYTFSHWEEEGETISEDPQYRFSVEGDRQLVAVFVRDEEDEDKEDTRAITLYFGCPRAIHTGEPGEHGYVTPVSREIAPTDEILRATIEELIAGPTDEEEAPCDECQDREPCDECLTDRVHPVVPGSLCVLGINVADGVATIDFCSEMFAADDAVAGTLGGTVFVQSIVHTATQFSAVEKVQVLVEGEYWDDGHMIWDEPLAPSDIATAAPQPRPAEIEEWVQRSRELRMGQAREYDDTLYLLVTYGEQPTGGYDVKITDVTEKDDHLAVTVHFTEPAEGDEVTPAVTHPYVLKKTEPTDLPVKFFGEGARSVVPILCEELDWLPPLAAGEGDIRIISPAPGDEVPREFTVEGIELVFEGTVRYRLFDDTGEELKSGITTGHGYRWGTFAAEITVPDEVAFGEDFTVEVYSESPVDGSIENLVRLQLVVAGEQ